MPTVALRFVNVFGPRQALSNPYIGVLAIFTPRLLSGKAPIMLLTVRHGRS
jgi:dTDP-L-rhamnose 4-epimerase